MPEQNEASARVLVVEDQADLNEAIARVLQREGFQVLVAYRAAEALEVIEEGRADAVILDLNLPDMDGVDVCRRIREVSDVPVLMLTARTAEKERVAGLEAGADDYITKPFSIRELVARLRAVLRRRRPVRQEAPQPTRRVLQVDDILLDRDGYQLYVRGKPVPVTPTEFKILRVLMENRGRVVSREELARAVWGDEPPDSHVIDVHISKVRSKIGDSPKQPKHLHTIRGLGYRFD